MFGPWVRLPFVGLLLCIPLAPARASDTAPTLLRQLPPDYPDDAPPESGAATKVEGLADTVRTGGFAAIGGDTDVEVTFPVTVN